MTADLEVNILITDSAVTHFEQLIEKEDVEGMGLRIFLDHPGSPMAEVGISFCPPGDNKATDIKRDLSGFVLYIDKLSAPYLNEAKIDYQTSNLGGQLAITAPNLRGAKPKEDASLKERIEYILNSEINPNLASHGGMVSVVDVSPDNEVVLRFGGGCQGCGMADYTLKEGIEKNLKAHFPEISRIIDATDHASGENPYYQ